MVKKMGWRWRGIDVSPTDKTNPGTYTMDEHNNHQSIYAAFLSSLEQQQQMKYRIRRIEWALCTLCTDDVVCAECLRIDTAAKKEEW